MLAGGRGFWHFSKSSIELHKGRCIRWTDAKPTSEQTGSRDCSFGIQVNCFKLLRYRKRHLLSYWQNCVELLFIIRRYQGVWTNYVVSLVDDCFSHHVLRALVRSNKSFNISQLKYNNYKRLVANLVSFSISEFNSLIIFIDFINKLQLSKSTQYEYNLNTVYTDFKF